MPFFSKHANGETGQTMRQCSKEYKIDVVERAIRRDVLGLNPRQRLPKNAVIHQYFGISLDEARRSLGIKKRLGERANFPLIARGWTRADCLRYLETRVPHQVPRSACVFCPYHSDKEWLEIKKSPEDWKLAVAVDASLRDPQSARHRGMRAILYAHRSCIALDNVEFKHERQFNFFTTECEGVCGV